jgi:ribosomal-protein-alanine N-acetyltransferase
MLDTVAVRRLGPGDEWVLDRLALEGPRYDEADDAAQKAAENDVPLSPADAAAFLADDHTHLFAAFCADHEPADHEPVGFVVVNELLHRHTFTHMLLVYEIGVRDDHRRRGVGRALLDAVRELATQRGIPEGFVLTNESNAPAMAFYAATGGARPSLDVAEWDFDYRSPRL